MSDVVLRPAAQTVRLPTSCYVDSQLDHRNLWKLLGGALPRIVRVRPSKERGAVWMVSNVSLQINNPNSSRHPVIVISPAPSLLVTIGSDSHRYDVDAVTECFDDTDLDLRGGMGFSSPTTFDVCELLPLAEKDLTLFMGVLTSKAWERMREAMGHCW